MPDYTIYKTTNLITGDYYIGMHVLHSPKGSYYLGSGTILKHAIKKYGRDSFKKEILFNFKTKQEMIDKEKEIVTEEFCSRQETYNLKLGGIGGCEKGRVWSDENINNRKISAQRKQSKKILCIETNQVFPSIGEAARSIKGSTEKIDNLTGACSFISGCAKGKYQTAYGFTWKFVD